MYNQSDSLENLSQVAETQQYIFVPQIQEMKENEENEENSVEDAFSRVYRLFVISPVQELQSHNMPITPRFLREGLVFMPAHQKSSWGNLVNEILLRKTNSSNMLIHGEQPSKKSFLHKPILKKRKSTNKCRSLPHNYWFYNHDQAMYNEMLSDFKLKSIKDFLEYKKKQANWFQELNVIGIERAREILDFKQKTDSMLRRKSSDNNELNSKQRMFLYIHQPFYTFQQFNEEDKQSKAQKSQDTIITNILRFTIRPMLESEINLGRRILFRQNTIFGKQIESSSIKKQESSENIYCKNPRFMGFFKRQQSRNLQKNITKQSLESSSSSQSLSSQNNSKDNLERAQILQQRFERNLYRLYNFDRDQNVKSQILVEKIRSLSNQTKQKKEQLQQNEKEEYFTIQVKKKKKKNKLKKLKKIVKPQTLQSLNYYFPSLTILTKKNKL